MATKKVKNGRGGRRPGAGRKPTLRDPVTFSVTVERSVYRRLEALAKRKKGPLAAVVRDALAVYVARRGRSRE